MTMDPDILQDYLPEARELLEQAQNDTLALESDPDNDGVLASLFRAFHTLKGGAGFLEAEALVGWTHHLEDLLDKMRSRTLPVTSARIDAILRGMDVIEEMLCQMAQGELPSPGPDVLGQRIVFLADPASDSLADGSPAPASGNPMEATSGTEGAIGGETFDEAPIDHAVAAETLLVRRDIGPDGQEGLFLERCAALEADRSAAPVDKGVFSACAEAASDHVGSDEITEEEFEHYLDQLYGGQAPGLAPVVSVTTEENTERTEKSTSPGQVPSGQIPSDPAGSAARAESGKPVSSKAATPSEVGESTIRVEAARLDAVMNQVGELVLLRNRFLAAVQELAQENEGMSRIAREMDLTVNDMQGTVMRLRMQPCKRLFQQLPRVVRDVSRQLHKEVNLVIVGEDVEIDKTVVDSLSAPLVHLVRNSMDHGIELPADRKALGKPETATLRVAAIHLGDKVRIEVSDDGKGIDRQMVTRKAVEKGLLSAEEAARLSDQEAFELIFRPGFSTNDSVTEFSGRGVGMDVVKETTRQLRGRLDVQTEPGRGTTIAMEFPLTLAVLPVLYLRLRRDVYALPISAVESLLEVEPSRIHSLRNRDIYHVDNSQVVPILDLGHTLHGHPLRIGTEPTDGILTERGLLIVSDVLGNEDSVVKPVDFLPEENWYQGATISGKGDVVLILDVGRIFQAGSTRSGQEVVG